MANFGLGNPEASLADLKTAAAQSPTSPVPWEIMGRVYDRLGQPDNAAAANTKAEQLSQPGDEFANCQAAAARTSVRG